MSKTSNDFTTQKLARERMLSNHLELSYSERGKKLNLGGSPGLLVWEKTHVKGDMGSNPSAVHWMDMTFFTFIYCKNCIACLKRPKINCRGQSWPI